MASPLTLVERYEINERHVDGIVDQVRIESAMYRCVHLATQALEVSLMACDPHQIATITAHLLIRAAHAHPTKGVTP